MRFDDSKSIFLQIAGYIEELILAGEYVEEGRIPSVRELAAGMEVNPNTVIRTYAQLQEAGIIYNQRGMGYFVASGAAAKILEHRRSRFVNSELPEVFRTMKLLGLNIEDLRLKYNEFLAGGGVDENQ